MGVQNQRAGSHESNYPHGSNKKNRPVNFTKDATTLNGFHPDIQTDYKTS